MENAKKEKIDVLGLRCPEPLMLIRKKMRELSEGDILEIIADDPATLRDVPNLCTHLGYTLVSVTSDSPYVFVLRR
jgi:tRNA 2-thiouridine synthesizing protein A